MRRLRRGAPYSTASPPSGPLKMEMIGVQGIEFRSKCRSKPRATLVSQCPKELGNSDIVGRPPVKQCQAPSIRERDASHINGLRRGMATHPSSNSPRRSYSAATIARRVVKLSHVTSQEIARRWLNAVLHPHRQTQCRLATCFHGSKARPCHRAQIYLIPNPTAFCLKIVRQTRETGDLIKSGSTGFTRCESLAEFPRCQSCHVVGDPKWF